MEPRTVSDASKHGVNCTGGEEDISECIRNRENDNGVCTQANFVRKQEQSQHGLHGKQDNRFTGISSTLQNLL